MNNFDTITIITIVATLISTLVAVYSVLIKSITKKNSMRSEKILFEMKQANDATNHKLQDIIINNGGILQQEEKVHFSSILQEKNGDDEKLDNLIHNHHLQALSQSKIQFWFSLIAAVVGFIFIIIMVCLASTNVWYEYIVRILPGAIIEAVSVLFFSQSRETRERSSDFLNRLREDKQYEKGIAIAESISDEKLKSILKAEIALRLCGITDINIFENEKNP